MTSMASGVPPHDPRSQHGWLSQLLAALWRTLFDERWEPFVRLMVALVVIVMLYVVVRTYA